MGQRPGATVQKVKDLLLADGSGWDLDKLNEAFFEVDVADILKIPIGRAGTDDYVAWNYTKNGQFSVRSAYHLKQHLKSMAAGRPGSSMNCVEHKGWLSLWAAKVPAKAKIHCWRLAKNGLAVGEELRRRSIKYGVRCIVCSREETLHHRFWACPHSKRTWEVLREHTTLALNMPPHDCRSHGEFQHWLLTWFASLKDDELNIIIMALYHLWLARNEARDEPMIEDPEKTARRILFLVEEWGNLRSDSPPRSQGSAEQWRPPENGWHKVNVDSSFDGKVMHGGGGLIIRDHHGVPLAGGCHFSPMSPIRRGLS
jgi:hypothetical protein